MSASGVHSLLFYSIIDLFIIRSNSRLQVVCARFNTLVIFFLIVWLSGCLDGSEESGVVHNCNMLCDQQPCQNGGACLEDFRSNTYHCDCEMTSYSGSYCTEGTFGILWGRKHACVLYLLTTFDSISYTF
jgi:hypothetical protein